MSQLAGLRQDFAGFVGLMSDILRFPQFWEVTVPAPRINSVSQEVGLLTQLRWMQEARESIFMFGYDAPFMQREETQVEMMNLICGSDPKKPPFTISAIVPESQECPHLDELNVCSNFGLYRTPRDLERGFVLYDDNRATGWDKGKPNEFPTRAGNEEYFRTRSSGSSSYMKGFEKVFREHRKKFCL